ncbi:hypothetical protein [Neobacillus vireti]|uniref:hypothetical protein n=1 Tax=Neobacillus vireti TaxID=220686 RepID=UPI002FFE8965
MKKWYESKTVWVNGLVFLAAILQAIYGKEIISPAAQVIILSAINTALRLITKHEINWKGDVE